MKHELRFPPQYFLQMWLLLSPMKERETSCGKATIDRGFDFVFKVNETDHWGLVWRSG
jgi:hypothetical protein